MKIKYLISLCLIVFFLMSVTDVSASKDINLTAESEILSTGTFDDAIGVSIDENIISSDNRGWYVNASASDDGDGSNSTPYNNFKSVLDNSNLRDGDSVYFAGGEIYAGDGINVNLNISKQLNLLKYGAGEVVFDAQYDSRIFEVTTLSINITGLTFVNGNAKNGGAIYFTNDIYNSNINATYINNSATLIGGANYFRGTISNSNIFGTYSHNNADVGGVNYFSTVLNSSISGIFNYNNAADVGGVNYFNSVLNSSISGTYSHNAADVGGVNHFESFVSNSTILGNYINDTATQTGGVNHFESFVSNSTILGNYINNTATDGNGGANCFLGGVSNSTIFGIFDHNIATEGDGGANYFRYVVSNSNITGTYINNAAKNGGANEFFNPNDEHAFVFSTLSGTYINNTATNGNGGANCFLGGVSNSTIFGIFDYNIATGGDGGANYFRYVVSNSNITGTYINNAAKNGGANEFFNLNDDYAFVFSTLSGTYINNTATQMGGANSFEVSVLKSNLNGTYINNTSNDVGGTTYLGKYFEESTINGTYINNKAEGFGGINHIIYPIKSKITGTYINNTSKSIIYMYQEINEGFSEVSNAIFLNNKCIYVIYSESTSEIANNNWFGNNQTNYKNKPNIGAKIEMDTWLFLNATADYSSIPLYGSSDILFKLYSYNKVSGVYGYDNSKVPSLNLILAASNGIVDKNIIYLDETVEYNATKSGQGSVIASVEDAECTIFLDNIGFNPELSVSVGSQEIDYGYGTSIILDYNATATGLINITLIGEEDYYSFDDVDLNTSILLPEIILPDNYNIIVSYSGDEIFRRVSANATLNINKLNPELSVEDAVIDYGDIITVVLHYTNNATGFVDILFSGENYGGDVWNEPLNNTIIIEFALLPDVYNVTVEYYGNQIFETATANATLIINKLNITPQIDSHNNKVTFNVHVNAKGNITLLICNETFTSPIKNGVAIFDLSDVPSGNYDATISYLGDDKYNGFEIDYPICIEDKFILSADNLNKYYGGSERFFVNLTDSEGNPLANAIINININGASYNRTTDSKGQASMAINLNSGEYPVVVRYNGTFVNATITVLATVNGTDVIKVYKNATQYYATFCDSEGNYLKDGTTIIFNINGVFYDRQISGDKGLARLNINLKQGYYILTAINPVTRENAVNSIIVIAKLVENNDITKYYRNETQYTVKIIGDDGNPVGAGETVTFKINGVFYNRTTNESGIAKLNINLQQGDYIITAEYKNCRVSNNITVLPVLSAKDITMKYHDGTKFVVTLVDGQGKPYVGQTVQFNICGVFYNRVTDASGQAKLNINLMSGEYIITSSYNGANIANKITIKSWD